MPWHLRLDPKHIITRIRFFKPTFRLPRYATVSCNPGSLCLPMPATLATWSIHATPRQSNKTVVHRGILQGLAVLLQHQHLLVGPSSVLVTLVDANAHLHRLFKLASDQRASTSQWHLQFKHPHPMPNFVTRMGCLQVLPTTTLSTASRGTAAPLLLKITPMTCHNQLLPTRHLMGPPASQRDTQCVKMQVGHEWNNLVSNCHIGSSPRVGSPS